MPKKADIGSKRLISLAPDLWVQWVTQIPNLEARTIISADFQWISREGDVLIRVYSPEDGEFLVLNELQLRYDEQMPRRMRAYAALAEEKYKLPVYPILINILQPSSTIDIATRYQSQFRDIYAHQDYRIINLWEVEVEIAFQPQISSLLPFVPVLKGGNEEAIIRRALQILRTDKQLSGLETLLAFFATFVLDSQLVQQIMRWDMAVLEQSPWYQEIEQRGRRRELLPGIALGLDLKFGRAGRELLSEIEKIEDVELLVNIREAIRSVKSVDELRQLYLN